MMRICRTDLYADEVEILGAGLSIGALLTRWRDKWSKQVPDLDSAIDEKASEPPEWPECPQII